MKKIGIPEALNSLRPNSNWSLLGEQYSGLSWLDNLSTLPSEEEINNEIIRLQSEYDSLEYQRQRLNVYPPLNEQLDMIYWDKINSTNNWIEMITNVKSQFPKNI
jgi:hypothetical protein